ncbi:MAG: bifunctional 3,4-dihydroxy-2-butanone-4-phosphate synthase/GTP cyclohydrolase II [Bacteriovoracaceae bacterium]|jgi:3,4-dihydroxy 2-butanone 4-phosphate synthase / GTP cyclohydrolase II|nr:bifunctional 3,4-dihydroxy-2-butanone-4-phosphate synthase/GTP cyclohydrolase II [Bacteriovoracaceae bacterium]
MTKKNEVFDSIESALEDIKAGKIIIVVDNEDRENEGDFVMAADKATPEAINFMAKFGRGIICTPITMERSRELELPYMVDPNTNSSKYFTPFTLSVDLIEGCTTGISAEDRAKTILAITDQKTSPDELSRPGHIFPLIAQDEGVLVRQGHTEAAVDLAKLSGLYPAGVICEIMNDDGTMSRLDDLVVLAEKFDLKLITIDDLIEYRNLHEVIVTEQVSAKIPNKFGPEFDMRVFVESSDRNQEHLALIFGDLSKSSEPLVRIHSECLTGDLLASRRCDCGEQLKKSIDLINKEGQGVVLYMRQEGRGIGLVEKLKAYNLQDQGQDTVEANLALGHQADARSFIPCASILRKLGLQNIRLLTNNPKKINGLKACGIEVTQRVSLEMTPNEYNQNYLQTKRDKLGHLIMGAKQDKNETPLFHH